MSNSKALLVEEDLGCPSMHYSETNRQSSVSLRPTVSYLKSSGKTVLIPARFEPRRGMASLWMKQDLTPDCIIYFSWCTIICQSKVEKKHTSASASAHDIEKNSFE
jgi:hypothetical protein